MPLICMVSMIQNLMFLTDNSEGFAPELLYMNGKQWRNESGGNIILQVFFVDKPPPGTDEKKILTVMREWSKHCGIRFVRTNYLRESDIRITFEEGLIIIIVHSTVFYPGAQHLKFNS